MAVKLCSFRTGIVCQGCVSQFISRVAARFRKLFQVTIRPIPKSKFASDVRYFPPLTAAVKAKPNIDTAFLRQLRAILFRIAFTSFRSKETLLVFLHSFFLVLRTVLSVAVAKLDGRIARDLVRIFCVSSLCSDLREPI